MLNDPNIFGQFVLLILPLLFVGKKKTGLGSGGFFVIPVALVLLFGVYLTISRGALTGLAVLICLYLVHRFKKAGSVASVVVGALSLVPSTPARGRYRCRREWIVWRSGPTECPFSKARRYGESALMVLGREMLGRLTILTCYVPPNSESWVSSCG